MMKIRIFLCFFCFISLPVNLIAEENPTDSNTGKNNQVYKSVDPDGNVSFSDEPKSNAEKIKVRTLPTINIAPSPNIPTYESPTKTEEDIAYSELVITSPQEDENIWNQPVIAAQIKLQPGLKKNHKVSIMLDGVVLPGKGLSRSMENLNRGTHTLSSQIKDSQGKTIQQAKPIKFHVHKTSAKN